MLDATMDSSHTLWLDILDQPVQIEFAGDSSLLSSAREWAVEAWGELVLAIPPVAPPSPTAADGREEPAPLVFNLTEPGGIEHLLDQLSSRATLAGIEARSGDLLMLHAAGLADPQSGRVVACVAPSGTGKTTLSRAAAGKLLYVTDETVAVTRSGEVVRYPKPLSVKQRGDGWAPKSQHRPQSFGLEVAGASGLTLGAVVLLTRVRDRGEDPAPYAALPARLGVAENPGNPGVSGVTGTLGTSGSPEVSEPAAPPVLEEVDLFDAIVALVSELSYLGRMPEPLHWLAETLLGVGGVRRLRYREAEQAIPVLQELLRGDAEARFAPHPGRGTGLTADPVAASREESDRWRDALARHSAAGRTPAAAAAGAEAFAAPVSAAEPFAVPAAALEDMLIDPETGRVLIFGDNTVRMISSIAAATLLAASEGLTVDALRGYLIDLFGEPEQEAGGAPASGFAPAHELERPADPIAEVVRALVEHGLLA